MTDRLPRFTSRACFRRVGEDDGLADVSQLLINGVGERVDGWRLIFAWDDEAFAAMGEEICNHRLQPGAGEGVGIPCGDGLKNRPGVLFHLAGFGDQSLISPWPVIVGVVWIM